MLKSLITGAELVYRPLVSGLDVLSPRPSAPDVNYYLLPPVDKHFVEMLIHHPPCGFSSKITREKLIRKQNF